MEEEHGVPWSLASSAKSTDIADLPLRGTSCAMPHSLYRRVTIAMPGSLSVHRLADNAAAIARAAFFGRLVRARLRERAPPQPPDRGEDSSFSNRHTSSGNVPSGVSSMLVITPTLRHPRFS